MESNFIRRLLIASIACTVTVAANAQNYEFARDQRVFDFTNSRGTPRKAVILPTVRPDGGWLLPTARCATPTPCQLSGLELEQWNGFRDVGSIVITKGVGRNAGSPGGFVVTKNTETEFETERRQDNRLYGITFTDHDILATDQAVSVRITGTPVIPTDNDLTYVVYWVTGVDPVTNEDLTDNILIRVLFCDNAPTVTDFTQCGKERIRAGGERVAGDPVASSGGSSGGGAIAAVAVIGGVVYWLKKRNPTAAFNFAALPTDTNAYTAQFNYAPRENWNVNFEYTEGNLFASNDFVKPETNSTAKMTVKYTW